MTTEYTNHFNVFDDFDASGSQALAILRILGEKGVPLSELFTQYNAELSDNLDPWGLKDVAAITSGEPLSFARHALDERVLKGVDSGDGSYTLFTTTEMAVQASRYKAALTFGDLGVNTVLLGSVDNIPEALERLRTDARKRFSSGMQVNLTPGMVEFKDALKPIAIDANSSIVRINHVSNDLVHIHGTKNVSPTEELVTSWGRIGIAGLLKLYGWDMERDNDQQNKLEVELAERVGASSAFALAATNIEYLDEETRQKAEFDLVGVNRAGKLVIGEVKACAPNTLKSNLRTAKRQLEVVLERTKQADRLIILPDDPTAMIKEISSTDERQGAKAALTQATRAGISVLGISEFSGLYK